MADLTRILRIVIPAGRYKDRVFKRSDIDEPHPDGEKYRAHNQPQNGQWHDTSHFVEHAGGKEPVDLSECIVDLVLKSAISVGLGIFDRRRWSNVGRCGFRFIQRIGVGDDLLCFRRAGGVLRKYRRAVEQKC